MSRGSSIALRVALSVALLAAVLSRAKLGEVGGVLAGSSLPWIGAAAVLLAIGPWVSALRWRTLIAVHGAPPTVFFLFRSYLYGIFLNNFFPSTVGADAFRALQVPRSCIPLSVSMVTVVVERIVGLVALLLMSLLFLPVVTERFHVTIPWIPLVAAALVAVPLLWHLIVSDRWLARLRGAASRRPWLVRPVALVDKVVTPLRGFLAAPGSLALALLLSVVIQVNVILFMICLARALHLEIPALALFGVIPLTRLVVSLPVTINGIGLREGSMVFFLAAWDIPSAAAVAMAWLDYGLVLVEGMLGWVIWVVLAVRNPGEKSGTPGEKP